MKKGFTISKLIVLIILFITFIVFFVGKITGNEKKVEYNNQINKIVDATKIWGNNHDDLLPKNNEEAISIPLLLLKQEGLLPIDFKNPKTDEKFYDNMYIDIVFENGNHAYNVIENSGDKYFNTDVAAIVLKETYNYDRINKLSVCEVVVFENKNINSTITFLKAIYNLDGTKCTISYTYDNKTFSVERKAR